MAIDTRAAAARALAAVFSGQSLNQALPALLEDVRERDRALLQQLCYGTLRSYPRLRALLELLLDKPMKAKDGDVRALLMLGIYQLEETRIPDHAAVAATVGATADLNKGWAKGLTNAILRRFQRERESLLAQLDDAARAAHPQWLFEAIASQWPGEAEQIIATNNLQPPMTLRVNRRLGERETCLEQLTAAGIEASPGRHAPESIYLAQPMDVNELPGFARGELSVQDEAAQLAALLLGARPGERILDACAAPGGKTCHILELQPQLSELVAMDIDPARLERVGQNLARLQLDATLLAGDAGRDNPLLRAQSFDRILLDAPCSASGVIRRHPDVKLLRRASDIPQLGKAQLRLLRALWPLVKSGGTLLYATCSILREENAEVIDAFLDSEPSAKAVTPELDWGVAAGRGRQLLPRVDGPDGLFYALLEKAHD